MNKAGQLTQTEIARKEARIGDTRRANGRSFQRIEDFIKKRKKEIEGDIEEGEKENTALAYEMCAQWYTNVLELQAILDEMERTRKRYGVIIVEGN